MGVQNPSSNAWAGSIQISTPTSPFSPLVCADGCNSIVASTADLVVGGDADSDKLAPLHCLNGNVCTLMGTFDDDVWCLKINTGEATDNGGTLNVYVIGSDGSREQVASGNFSEGQTVLHACYPTEIQD